MARKIGFGTDDGAKSAAKRADLPEPAEPAVLAPGRKRALILLPIGLVLEALAILFLVNGYALIFAGLMVAGIAAFTTGTVAIIRIARGRGL